MILHFQGMRGQETSPENAAAGMMKVGKKIE
jgi:hypothetical protein